MKQSIACQMSNSGVAEDQKGIKKRVNQLNLSLHQPAIIVRGYKKEKCHYCKKVGQLQKACCKKKATEQDKAEVYQVTLVEALLMKEKDLRLYI